ncbi:unnamed protein product [Protopolystoma xenopodis]|uniref:Uncharacterized protein n=1 Tax=Protopolystoma xenopodis TaxID=117903 RepID=A0A448XJT4_9PLAT|nr:unnamed protein product [Protopolystoma xenopodis]
MEAEARLRVLTKERAGYMQRMTQLETKRDEAIREAALINGRASAEREVTLARNRELAEIREERDAIRRELYDLGQLRLADLAEKQNELVQLRARLREVETQGQAKLEQTTMELERLREELENLQVTGLNVTLHSFPFCPCNRQTEVQLSQASELNQKANNRQLKRQVTELEDHMESYTRKVVDLEHQASDLEAELSRTKAQLVAVRKAGQTAYRAGQARAMEDWSSIGHSFGGAVSGELDCMDDQAVEEAMDATTSPVGKYSEVPSVAKRMIDRLVKMPSSTTSAAVADMK